MSLFKRKPKSEHVPEPPVVLPVQSNIYEFIIKSENDESDKLLEKYQKFWTDPEDKYNGMTMRELKESDLYGEKVYQYPPLYVSVKLSAFLGDDGSVIISGYILDGDSEIYVGKSAKTKTKKILKILQDESPTITGELYGGQYWKLEDSGYVDNRWSDVLTIRVSLRW